MPSGLDILVGAFVLALAFWLDKKDGTASYTPSEPWRDHRGNVIPKKPLTVQRLFLWVMAAAAVLFVIVWAADHNKPAPDDDPEIGLHAPAAH